MNLKPRFLILTTALILLASAAALIAFLRVAEGIVGKWGVQLAEAQALYDKSRLLQPLIREIALAKQMANSSLLREWARKPHDPELERLAIVEMESFRGNFSDGSYFVALLDSGAYYHNNAANEFAGAQLRYHLSHERPADAWFYRIVAEGRDFHLNVNPDEHLGVTKLWIDVLLRDGERVLGVVGTGLDLDPVLRDVVHTAQPGVTTLFVDHLGAIQLARDQKLIDFASIAKTEGEHSTLDALRMSPEDRADIHAAMHELESGKTRVTSRFVEVDGRRFLAGIAWLPELGWFEIALLDLDVVMPLHSFGGLAAVFAAALLVTLLGFNLVLNRLVLQPLAALENAMRRLPDGSVDASGLPRGHGEIGRLMGHFAAMATAIRDYTGDLEGKVAARTEALHRLARIDPLTELYNRRGMSELIEQELSRARRNGKSPGVLWFDVDHFKQINDRAGHAIGDATLATIARLLGSTIRQHDSAARWGGDEFLVLLPETGIAELHASGERIREAIEREAMLPDGSVVTVSIGACLARPGESLEDLLRRADAALYAAKSAGRNCLRGAEACEG